MPQGQFEGKIIRLALMLNCFACVKCADVWAVSRPYVDCVICCTTINDFIVDCRRLAKLCIYNDATDSHSHQICCAELLDFVKLGYAQ